jgi:ribosomal protein L3
MGGNKKTVQNLKVLKIDPVRDLIYVNGGVPGNAGEEDLLRYVICCVIICGVLC